MSIQGTDEWFADRCGFATASRFKDVLAKIKTGEAAGRRNYRAQLVCERLTGKPAESYSNAAMEWGIQTEPLARMAYEAFTGFLVVEVGFVKHGSLLAGASPDGEIDTDGLFECKCPNTATHIETLLNGMPPEHLPQIQGQLWITGRKWADFVSFDPRLPEKLQMHVERIQRDDIYIKRLETQVTDFLKEVDATVKRLNALGTLVTADRLAIQI
jgi:YqaJ-like recombinase protein